MGAPKHNRPFPEGGNRHDHSKFSRFQESRSPISVAILARRRDIMCSKIILIHFQREYISQTCFNIIRNAKQPVWEHISTTRKFPMGVTDMNTANFPNLRSSDHPSQSTEFEDFELSARRYVLQNHFDAFSERVSLSKVVLYH